MTESPTTESLRDAIYANQLDAELNHRYWREMARRYAQRERRYKIFLAVMASGAVAGWGLWEVNLLAKLIWQTMSGVAALVAIILPIVDWSGKVNKMSIYAGQFDQSKRGYEFLLMDLEQDPESSVIRTRYEGLRNQEAGFDPSLPHDQELIDELQGLIEKEEEES